MVTFETFILEHQCLLYLTCRKIKGLLRFYSQSYSEAEKIQNDYDMDMIRDLATVPGFYTYQSSSDLMETTNNSILNLNNSATPRQTPPVI